MTNPRHASEKGGKNYQQQRRFARQCIVQSLYQSDTGNDWEWPEDKAAEFRQQVKDLEEPETPASTKHARTFMEQILAGIIQERNNLDREISQAASNWSLGRMSTIDRNILRLAAYEIKYRPEIPPLASINEAVELAKKFGDKDSPRFINGILDRLLKDST